MTKKPTPQKPAEKTVPKRLRKSPSNKLGKRTLLKQLVEFYWQILDDPDLKPSDRIASAKRLESLLIGDDKNDVKPQVKVVLNIPAES